MLLSMNKPANVWLRALSTGLLLASAVFMPLALIYRVVYPFKRERSREVRRLAGFAVFAAGLYLHSCHDY